MESVTDAMDLQLVRKAAGDQRALNEVGERLYPRVYQMVYLLVGSHQDASDVAQMCLLQILESLSKYRGEGPLEAWAGRLTYRVTVRQMKRIRTGYQTVVPVAHEPGQEAAKYGSTVDRARIREWLAGHLAKLVPERRETVVLHHVYGYTMNEIGELMHVSPNTAKSRMLQAIRDLQASVAREGTAAATMLEGIDD
jgi:RNA polymerase sigma-70 factor (ECF subfamily)